MAQAIISRKGGGGGGYATVTFDNAKGNNIAKTTTSPLSSARYELAATTVGDYALFGGGFISSVELATVDAYNTSLTRSTPTELSVARYDFAATTVGNYALFGGGYDYSIRLSTVDAYNSSLTRSTPTALSQARNSLAATTVGDYALFGGGSYSDSSGTHESNIVDAYNTSLTRSNPTELSLNRDQLSSTTVGGFALFAGGRVFPPGASGAYATSVIDAYNENLTHSVPIELSAPNAKFAGTTVGNYALFGSGNLVSVGYATDAFYIQGNILVYPGTKYKLGTMTDEATSDSMQMITTTAPITGYIKIKDTSISS